MARLDDERAIEVSPGLWWVGFADREAGFSNNPYLLVDGSEAVLFDPGPGHPVYRDIILDKILQVTEPERIRYVVLSHQDPDLCGVIPYIERNLHPDVLLLCHPRTALFLPYYGIRSRIRPVSDRDVLRLRSGREILSPHTPYLHFAGTIMSYDTSSESLISGDVFAVFDRDWKLYADESYLERARLFIEMYVSSADALEYARLALASLSIKRVLPQHGGIIEQELVGDFLELLRTSKPGQLLEELRNPPSADQLQQLLGRTESWLAQEHGLRVGAADLEGLTQAVQERLPAALPGLYGAIAEGSHSLGIGDPMAGGQVLDGKVFGAQPGSQLLESLRGRYLSRRFGVQSDHASGVESMVSQGLQSVTTELAILSADIRGFTGWCEHRSASAVMAQLSQQHDVVARIIGAHGGRVNKLLGDGVLAYFPRRALSNVVPVANEIHRAIAEADLLPMGIGVDYGEVVMGDIGQEARLDYTIIGAPVNYASRFSDAARPGETAISANLLRALGDDARRTLEGLPSAEAIKVRIKPKDPEIEGLRFHQAQTTHVPRPKTASTFLSD